MKIFLFFLEGNKNSKVGTKKNKVSQVSGNTGIFFRPNLILFAKT